MFQVSLTLLLPEAKVAVLSVLSGFKLPQTLSANEEEEISSEMPGSTPYRSIMQSELKRLCQQIQMILANKMQIC